MTRKLAEDLQHEEEKVEQISKIKGKMEDHLDEVSFINLK